MGKIKYDVIMEIPLDLLEVPHPKVAVPGDQFPIYPSPGALVLTPELALYEVWIWNKIKGKVLSFGNTIRAISPFLTPFLADFEGFKGDFLALEMAQKFQWGKWIFRGSHV